jgi:hypothetical protein
MDLFWQIKIESKMYSKNLNIIAIIKLYLKGYDWRKIFSIIDEINCGS